MKLKVGILATEVEATRDESRWLWEYLSFEDGRARFVHRKRRSADDRIRMFNPVARSFPGGFTSLVDKAARDAGFQVVVESHRVLPCARDLSADLSWLRDYQLEGVRRAATRERGLLWLPTAAGKTEIACGLALSYRCDWLFLVHRSQLMHQTADRFELRSGETAGRVGDDCWQVERFTVGTFQTLHAALKRHDPRALQLLDGVSGLVVDEAHTLPAQSFWGVAMSTRSAYWRVGMSATPLARGDRRSVLAIGALGPVIYRVRPDVLIERGVLARPRIRMLPINVQSKAPTFQGVYGECVVRNAIRNRRLVDLAIAAEKPALLFVKEIKHGRALVDRLQKAGLRVEFVWGQKSTAKRDAALQRLVRNDLDVVVCSVVFQEGIDAPALRSVINGAGGKSIIATLQRIGRGMRVESDAGEAGSRFEVWDVADRGNRMLERHTRSRRNAYEREGYEVETLDALWQPQAETAS